MKGAKKSMQAFHCCDTKALKYNRYYFSFSFRKTVKAIEDTQFYIFSCELFLVWAVLVLFDNSYVLELIVSSY